jgi:hypothetical protein
MMYCLGYPLAQSIAFSIIDALHATDVIFAESGLAAPKLSKLVLINQFKKRFYHFYQPSHPCPSSYIPLSQYYTCTK